MERDLERLNEQEFKRIFGVKRETFTKMVEILEREYAIQHSQGGKIPLISVKNRLEITLEYLREYRTMDHIGFDWGIGRSRVSKIIRWVEDTLIKEGTFRLPGKKVLVEADSEIEYIIVDATESPIERPKKNKKNITLGRKSDIR